jgi:intein-encoded DNA endonuclease-like protein
VKLKKTDNKKIIGSYLKGCFDSDGSVDKNRNRIRFSDSKNYVIHYLKKLKIKYTFNLLKRKNRKTLFIIRIYGKDNLLNFHKYIGFSIKRKQKRLENLVFNK